MATTARGQKAAATRKANKATAERLAKVTEALMVERMAVSQALSNGKKITLTTAFGEYELVRVSTDMWYGTYPVGQIRNQFSHRSFAGCNDGQWADILKQAGVARHPLFAAKPAHREPQDDTWANEDRQS